MLIQKLLISIGDIFILSNNYFINYDQSEKNIVSRCFNEYIFEVQKDKHYIFYYEGISVIKCLKNNQILLISFSLPIKHVIINATL